jgi:type I restriction enzyme S subunit
MSSIGNIGDSFLLKEIPANWDINESLFNLKPNSRVIPSFLFFVLSSPNAKKYFENNSTGSSFKSIKMQVLKQFNLNLPSIPEQQKIATFLSSIDEKLEKCQGQIKAMENWKKGLLQQMFV